MRTKLFFIAMSISLIVSAQTTRFRVYALDTAAQMVNQGFTNLNSLNICYAGTTIVYVKFYDSYAHAYAKAQKPVNTLMLGTDANPNNYPLRNYTGITFTNGLWIRCTVGVTDTAQSQTQPSVKPIVEMSY